MKASLERSERLKSKPKSFDAVLAVEARGQSAYRPSVMFLK